MEIRYPPNHNSHPCSVSHSLGRLACQLSVLSPVLSLILLGTNYQKISNIPQLKVIRIYFGNFQS